MDPKLPFWCVSYYLGAFGIVWLPYETRCKTGRTSAKVCATKLRRNFSQRTHPIHPKLTIWVYSALFGCLRKLGGKQAELMQKFVPRSRVGIFCNEHTRSTPLDPKLTFWCIRMIWEHSGLFVALRNSCKTGRTSAKVRATKLHRNFAQRTHSIHPIRP